MYVVYTAIFFVRRPLCTRALVQACSGPSRSDRGSVKWAHQIAACFFFIPQDPWLHLLQQFSGPFIVPPVARYVRVPVVESLGTADGFYDTEVANFRHISSCCCCCCCLFQNDGARNRRNANLVSSKDFFVSLGPWNYSSGCGLTFAVSQFSGEVRVRSSSSEEPQKIQGEPLWSLCSPSIVPAARYM